MGRKLVDITNKRFGRLVAIEYKGLKGNRAMWRCICACGNEKLASSGSLRYGSVKSCGCLKRETERKNIEKLRPITYAAQKKNNWKEGTDLAELTAKQHIKTKSGIKGVGWRKDIKRWVARIRFKGTSIHLGHYKKLEDAAKARKAAEYKYFNPILEKYGRKIIL